MKIFRVSSLIAVLAVAACGAEGDVNVCDQATQKVRTCLASLDCDQFADPSDREDCILARDGAGAASTAQACTGAYQSRSESLLKCTLDPQRLCTDCTDDTRGQTTEEPPSNGAKVFAWNSCYSGSGDGQGAYGHLGCLEQWGSYPASCLKITDRKYAPGKRCKKLCNIGNCNNGCFSLYKAGTSVDLLASFYQCKS